VRALVAAVVGAACIAGCVFERDNGAARRHGRVYDVVVRDFAIDPPSHLAAGDVVFRVRNEGPDDHELILVHAVGELPVRRDGITADEDALKGATVGALEPSTRGDTRKLSAHLVPGRYEFFCNMAGHFRGGMHAPMTVGQ
jgi:uncharacterized cupredoxin-like copper-binding protein